MKKTLLIAIPAIFALAACGETASEEVAETENAAMDDNDAAEPVAEDHHDDAEPHDESVPHEH